MKISITIFLVVLYATLSFTQDNIGTVISESEDHSIFTDLLEFTGLDVLLNDDYYYSVFAPDDKTFLDIFSLEQLDSLKLHEQEYLHQLISHHIVPDTFILDFFSEPYLPLHGNFIRTFVDAAANVLVYSGTTGSTSARLKYPHYSDDVYLEGGNGRILWMDKDLIFPLCKTLDEYYYDLGDVMFRSLSAIGLEDSIRQSAGPLTFIISEQSKTIELIDNNGGLVNSPFLDSFVRRHIINGYYPLQALNEGHTVTNWLGESLILSANEGQYFVNDKQIVNFRDAKNVVTLFIDEHLKEQETSAVNEKRIGSFKVFPNPAFDNIEVHVSPERKSSLITIFNTEGQVLYNQKILSPVTKIDVNKFNPGLYYVQYNNGSFVEVAKLVIAR